MQHWREDVEKIRMKKRREKLLEAVKFLLTNFWKSRFQHKLLETATGTKGPFLVPDGAFSRE